MPRVTPCPVKAMKRDADAQSTHYWLKRPKETRRDEPRVHREARPCPGVPVPLLLAGDEPPAHARLRYEMLQQIWRAQQAKIERILHTANTALFAGLLDFVLNAPRELKVPVGFLQLGSNIANNLRIFKELELYLASHAPPHLHLRIVNLSLRTCANLKATIREIVKQVTLEGDDDDDDDGDDDAVDAKAYHGKISYDFDIVREWCQRWRAEGRAALRIVIVIQDSDAFANQLLNQVLKLILAYSGVVPMTLIVGLLAVNSDIGSWLNHNLSPDLRLQLRGVLFHTVDNKSLGHRICNDLFLQYRHDDALVLSPELVAVVLGRFQSSNNSIDSLVSSFKLAYMIHFYQLPLAVLLSARFDRAHLGFYTAAMRKLPSFKRMVEVKLALRAPVVDLLDRDDAVMAAFDASLRRSRLARLRLLNATNVLYLFGGKEKIELYQLLATRQLFTLLHLPCMLHSITEVTQAQLDRIAELPVEHEGASDANFGVFRAQAARIPAGDPTELVSALKQYLKGFMVNDELPFCEVFTIAGGLSRRELLEEKQQNLIIGLLRPQIRATLEAGLDDCGGYLGNELVAAEAEATAAGGAERDAAGGAEGGGAAAAAASPFNPSETEGARSPNGVAEGPKSFDGAGAGSPPAAADGGAPILNKMFQVYKGAPVNINIYDFYSAFRETFDKRRDAAYLLAAAQRQPELAPLRADLAAVASGTDEDDRVWNKIVFAWFSQGCFELLQMGIVREKPKGDYLEKVVWKGV